MKLTCPSCQTTYHVAADALPPEGRQVRCKRCGHRWHAEARPDAPENAPEPAEVPAVAENPADDPPPADDPLPPPEAAPADPPAVAESPAEDPPPPTETAREAELVGASLVEDAAATPRRARREPGEDVEAAARRAARRVVSRQRGRRRAATRAARASLAAATLAIAVFAVQYRDQVSEALPVTAALYGAVGLPVNTRGLTFEALSPQRTIEDGVPTLVVEGKIRNVRNRQTEIPALRFVLRDRLGDELYNWTIEPARDVLDEGGELSFRTRLAAPPADAEAVELHFVERRLKQASVTQ